MTRYIEQNPVKSALVTRPEDYLWSSCRANIRGQEDGLVTGWWLDEKDREAYRTFLIQTDTLMDQKIRVNTSTGRPLGSEDFLSFRVEPLLQDQELTTSGSTGMNQYEGAVDGKGMSKQKAVTCQG